MVAFGYSLNRGLGLTIDLIIMLISSIQIILYLYLYKHKGNNHKDGIDLKLYIHYGCLFTSFTIMIGFIDSYGGYNLISFQIQKILVNTIGIRGVMGGVVIIIYGHFHAHYRAAKKDTPKFFASIFIISFILNLLGSVIGAILTETVNKSLFRIELIFQVVWIATILTIDGYGYFLVRKLIIDLKKYQQNNLISSPSSPTLPNALDSPSTTTNDQHLFPPVNSTNTPSPSPSPRDNTNSPTTTTTPPPTTTHHERGHDHYSHHHHSTSTEELLSHIRRFHILIFWFNGSYFIYIIVCLLKNSQPIFMMPNPENFVIGAPTTFLPYTILILVGILTWWAWTPFTIEGLIHSEKKKSRSSNLHRKMTFATSATSPMIIESDRDHRGIEKGSEEGGREGGLTTEIEMKSLVRSPSEEQVLLGNNGTQNNNNNNNNHDNDLEGQERERGGLDTLDMSLMSVSGLPETGENSGMMNVNVMIAENGQIVLPQT